MNFDGYRAQLYGKKENADGSISLNLDPGEGFLLVLHGYLEDGEFMEMERERIDQPRRR